MRWWCGEMMASERVEAMEKRGKVLAERAKRVPAAMWKRFWNVGREDPRRAIHAIKVGVALTLVSLLYLIEPLFKEVGQNAMWAVMTVVVVLEFTAGATLYKGLNRGLGTLVAGSLALFIQYVTTESDRIFRAILIGAAVFLIGSIGTYMRFLPYIKKNYDYGVVIFVLTFNLITVSSYRVENILKMADQRFYTIAMGCAICLLMSLFIFPIWSGEDLHNSTAHKFDGLAKSIQECVKGYFSDEKKEIGETESLDSEDLTGKGYKDVLDSKSSDENLALYASWEPRHSLHCYKFPWQRYVKLGAVLRHFGYTVVALHGCLQTEIQTPQSIRALFKDPCMRLAGEVSKALKELGDSIRNRRHCSPEILSDHLHEALQDLNAAIKSQPRLFLGSRNSKAREQHKKSSSLPSVKTDTSALMDWRSKKGGSREKEEERKVRPTLSKIAFTSLNFSEALPFAAFASLLVELVARLEMVIEEVEELGKIAHFKEFDGGDEDSMIGVKCEKPTKVPLPNQLPPHAGD
ncbi:PREDICTED: aluminum-activated malate transporter 12-like [Ipomoea nil]|uniref:aluminum-activated malate transporter 12-like n=1 Tax=Ipomoea nil TaxID=35883 RepID=UPI0009008F8E|nr:PREDICTED: aluminum-activated malate transporter 12-like [Ipomoea nil]